MKADTICCYCVSKRMTKEALQNHCMRIIIRARLTVYEVGVFLREISQLSKIRPPPSFRSHLSLSPMGVFSRDYGSTVQTRTGFMLFFCIHDQGEPEQAMPT